MPIKFCPKCGCTDFEEAREGKVGVCTFVHYGDYPILRCKKCGYTAKIFPEAKDKKTLEKIRKVLKK